MMNGSEHHRLELRLGNQLIGHLEYDSNRDSFQLGYLPEWQARGFPLSPPLALDGSASSAQIRAYLGNLLPENRGLDHLIEVLSVSRSNLFALIHGIGRDVSGAVTFTLPAEPDIPTRFRPITPEELMLRLEGRLGFGEGELCSTHLLKFEHHPHLVINEFVTMQLAAQLSMPVARVELHTVGQGEKSHRSLLVERFDRRLDEDGMRVRRRHMIDACQGLGFPVARKYERNFGDGRDVAQIREGVSLPRLFSLSALCVNPAQARLDMLQWLLFNLCVNNHDAHGKNYSFFVSKAGLTPTPWYDLVNVGLYPEFNQHLAMAIGDEFAPEAINAWQLLEMAEACDLPERLLQQTLQKIASDILHHLDAAIAMVETDHPAELDYLARYKDDVERRCHHFQEQAGLLPELQL
ncbi:HipA domain-containing protein [Aeromonas dhakensis]|uniref:HipA domain-containing protein n=1 Tax=Aeromonas dhakensis TaxID=196024 RepID=UPI003F793A2D